jgi:hypothetical protein
MCDRYALFAVVDEDEAWLLSSANGHVNGHPPTSSNAAASRLRVPLAGVGVLPKGATDLTQPKCEGGADGRDGFNHRWMAKLFLRFPTCLMLIERHERTSTPRVPFALAAFVRPDVLWPARVPHLAQLWHAHRHGRDVLTWDDHMAVMRREHAAPFFLGAAHMIVHCASVDDWMAACGLHLVERYQTEWYAPKPSFRLATPCPPASSRGGGGGGDGAHSQAHSSAGLTSDVYRTEVARFVENGEAPCSPVRLIAVRERVSVCDCGLLFTMGGRCLSLDGTNRSATLANTRRHTWVGQRPQDHADVCSGSFNLDASTHRNFWLRRIPPRLQNHTWAC